MTWIHGVEGRLATVLMAILPLALLNGTSTAYADEPPESAGPEPRVVIPFDFESRFDDGRYGAFVGDMIWKKLDRAGGFIIPESMLDVRQWSQRRGVMPNHQTPLAQLKEIVVDEFGADIAICGKVERVKGFELDVYDLWIKIIDFSTAEPRIVFETKARTKTVSEIPHTYVKQSLDALYGRGPEMVAGVDPEAERRWQESPNLVQGDFEKAQASPLGWSPLPRYVTRVSAQPDGTQRNHVIRFRFPEDVAASTGVLYYSDFFPVEEDATYRFECRWRTTGSAAKVFIKCYDDIPLRLGGNDDRTSKSRLAGRASSSQTERREVYRSQQNLSGPTKTWNTQTEDFTPKHTQYSPKWGRVMLYAYWPAGAVDWDDVVVKQIKPPPAARGDKVRRPSLETQVLSDELEAANRKLRNPPRTPEKDRP